MERVIEELIKAYDEYTELLGRSEGSLAGLAATHGWSCPPEMVSRGQELRDEIAQLKLDLRARMDSVRADFENLQLTFPVVERD